MGKNATIILDDDCQRIVSESMHVQLFLHTNWYTFECEKEMARDK